MWPMIWTSSSPICSTMTVRHYLAAFPTTESSSMGMDSIELAYTLCGLYVLSPETGTATCCEGCETWICCEMECAGLYLLIQILGGRTRR